MGFCKRFLVLELVEGETLAERLRRRTLTVQESLTIALQISHALEAAHECLEKEQRDRYRDVADARVDIEKALADPAGSRARKPLRQGLPEMRVPVFGSRR